MDEKKSKTPIALLVVFLILIIGFIAGGVEFKGDAAWLWTVLVAATVFLIAIVRSK